LVISLGYFKFPELLCKVKSLALHFSSGSLDYDTSDTSTFISYPNLLKKQLSFIKKMENHCLPQQQEKTMPTFRFPN